MSDEEQSDPARRTLVKRCLRQSLSRLAASPLDFAASVISVVAMLNYINQGHIVRKAYQLSTH